MITKPDAVHWWRAEESTVYRDVFDYVRAVDQDQVDIFERLYKLGCLYDQNDRLYEGAQYEGYSAVEGVVDENVVKPAVDTATSLVARIRPRVRVQTDGAEWSAQRRAVLLESYVEGLMKKARLHELAPQVFRDSCVFGLGVAKVRPDGEEIRVERVIWDEIIVDERECRSSAPRQMHQRKIVDRSALLAMFPEAGDAIAGAGSTAQAQAWVGWQTRPWGANRDDVVVIESWHLPCDDQTGRHTICVDSGTLLDEEWEHDWFPFATFRWNSRVTGFYGRGVVEDIAEHQRQARRLSWMIDRILHQVAVPRAYVHVSDAAMGLKLTNEIGAIVPYKTKPPVFHTPSNTIGEHYSRLERIKASAFEVVGISRLSAQALKPAGLESAVALREYNDQETARFAIQAQAYERWFVDVARLMIAWCKDLHKGKGGAPVVWSNARRGGREIDWDAVDLEDVPYTLDLDAASALSRTPAGRTSTVIEWMQAGLVNQDEGRKLLQHPDLSSAMSLYNAALEDIDAGIEDMLDGEVVVPEPYQNLAMGIWRTQMRYLDVKRRGAPEEVLELLRNWIVVAQMLLAQSSEAQAAQQAMAGGMQAGQPKAAMATQAMNLAPVG